MNLFLKVYGTRPDGYHEIQSVFQAVDIEDTIKFSLEKGRAGITIRTTHPDLPLGDDNLIVKAYKRIAEVKEPPAGEGVLCEIDKKIPIGAGLGGGSSNCAASLVALNSLLDANLEYEELKSIGAELGSDVPFFLIGGTAFVYGRGEKVEMLPSIKDGGFIIAVPSVKVDTSLAYKALDSYRKTKKVINLSAPAVEETRRLWYESILNNNFPSFMYNDFEEIIFQHYPIIEEMKKRLSKISGNVLMSGSGSAVFAYFPRYEDAWSAVGDYEKSQGEFLTIARPVKEAFEIHG